ncbi:MAG: hypothetical protein EF813_04105 [Methanosarcinales archaeon]|nr:MAG: hypothetical protein EF813_04105 [Methanosarcinales archaeon]
MIVVGLAAILIFLKNTYNGLKNILRRILKFAGIATHASHYSDIHTKVIITDDMAFTSSQPQKSQIDPLMPIIQKKLVPPNLVRGVFFT